MPDSLDSLAERCAEVLAEYDCPSVSVAVAEHGEVVLAEAYGVASYGAAPDGTPMNMAAGQGSSPSRTADAATRPATPGTAYALASITKPMTATAVCIAADEGLLDLDAPVPVPATASAGFRFRPPTPRELLMHRAGFAPFYTWEYADRAGDDGPGTAPTAGPGLGAAPAAPGAGRTIDPDAYLVQFRPPGTAFEYANLGYRLLGRLIEDASGQELGAFVRQRVYEPLGLDGCHLGPRYPGPAPSAVRYSVAGRAYPDYGSGTPGATLGWATAGQLALFTQSFSRLLKQSTAAAMLDALPVNDHLGYGLGWCVSRGDGPLVHSHGGGGAGVAALTVGIPERGLSVAVLTNSTRKAARDAIVGRLLPELVPGWRDAWIDPAAPDPARPLALPAGSSWHGFVSAPERQVPLRLDILTNGQVSVRLDGEGAIGPAQASARWDLRAETALQLPTADARINSPRTGLALRLDGGRLTGRAYAYKDGDAEGRLGDFLSHRCELRP